MNDVIVIGAGPFTGQLVKHFKDGDDMFGRVTVYDRGLAVRDKKITEIRRRLSLAYVSRNKTEVSRLSRELTYLGQSW